VPATIFVCPGFVGTTRRFWWERLADLVRGLDGRSPSRMGPVGPSGLNWRGNAQRVYRELGAWIAGGPHSEVETRLAAIARVSEQVLPGEDGRPDPLLGWQDLKTMQGEGWTIGAHGIEHANHVHLDPPALLAEAADSVTRVATGLGSPVPTYAYPYGHFTTETGATLRQAGIHLAYSTAKGVVTPTTDPLAVPRLQLNHRWPFAWAFQINEGLAHGS
jgi:peptidoglycan/xylan/chitin deacetylase (PgdA/CDA1 family)